MILRHAFIPPDNARLAHLCGSLDEHLRSIEAALDVTISRRNESFRVEGRQAPAPKRAVALLQSLYDRAAGADPAPSSCSSRWSRRRPTAAARTAARGGAGRRADGERRDRAAHAPQPTSPAARRTR